MFLENIREGFDLAEFVEYKFEIKRPGREGIVTYSIFACSKDEAISQLDDEMLGDYVIVSSRELANRIVDFEDVERSE